MKLFGIKPHIIILIALTVLLILIVTVMFFSQRNSVTNNSSEELLISPGTDNPDQNDDERNSENSSVSVIEVQDENENLVQIPTYSYISPEPSEIITPFYSDEYKEGQDIIDEAEEEEIQQSSTTGELLYELPYQRDTFSLDYDYSSFQFVLTLPQDNQSQGIEEFELYLEENGIEDPSWLEQLRIETVSELVPVEAQNQENQQQDRGSTQDETEEELLQIESL